MQRGIQIRGKARVKAVGNAFTLQTPTNCKSEFSRSKKLKRLLSRIHYYLLFSTMSGDEENPWWEATTGEPIRFRNWLDIDSEKSSRFQGKQATEFKVNLSILRFNCKTKTKLRAIAGITIKICSPDRDLTVRNENLLQSRSKPDPAFP
jgi:hypothetical protein